jgi:hypothetical protein
MIVEDELQDKVSETLRYLSLVGIKLNVIKYTLLLI